MPARAATDPIEMSLTSTTVEALRFRDMDATRVAIRLDLAVDDLPVGSLRMARAGDRRLCVARTASGVYALDHACPHEGYGLTQGVLEGNVLTCAWHNWKFRVDDGACVLGEEDVHPRILPARLSGCLPGRWLASLR